jgi:Lsr2
MKEILVRLKDDLDHKLIADRTVEFAFDGQAFEIDLTDVHYAEMAGDLERWIAAARKVKRRSHKKTKPVKIPVNGEAVAPVPPSDDGKELRRRIREYARSQGIEQSNVGLIKRESLEAFYAAHPEEVTG